MQPKHIVITCVGWCAVEIPLYLFSFHSGPETTLVVANIIGFTCTLLFLHYTRRS